MKLNILIVEDEVLTATSIKIELEKRGHKVVGICISYKEAVAAYKQKKPDLVIIDIGLYGKKSGIDFGLYLKKHAKQTPFVYLTSHLDRRVFDKAQQTEPHGYLSKPLQKTTLWATIETAFRLYQRQNTVQSTCTLTITDGNKRYRLQEREILCIESDHVYANIHLTDGRKIHTRSTLNKFLQQLKSKLLFQCHRSYIINTQHINGWDKNTVTLDNGLIIPVSRSKKQTLIAML